jgi:hypothetical protein
MELFKKIQDLRIKSNYSVLPMMNMMIKIDAALKRPTQQQEPLQMQRDVKITFPVLLMMESIQ